MAPPTAVLVSAAGEVERYGQPMSAKEFEQLMTASNGHADPHANGSGDLVVHQQHPISEDRP
jgi:hypothetical protein